MKYAKEIEDAGLHNAVDKILVKFPHLEELAKTDAKDFANDAIHLILPNGITLREYWKLAGIAAGQKDRTGNSWKAGTGARKISK